MIGRYEELKKEIREHMRGGEGSVEIIHFTDRAGLYDNGRMLARIILHPGCGVGLHGHENEEEIFIVEKGTAEYNDDGNIATVTEGDVTICASGQSHAIRNVSEEDCVLTALILDKKNQ